MRFHDGWYVTYAAKAIASTVENAISIAVMGLGCAKIESVSLIGQLGTRGLCHPDRALGDVIVDELKKDPSLPDAL